MQTLKPLLLLAYLAWCGGLNVRKFDGQWRAYLTKPTELLIILLFWALIEGLISVFNR